ncbi:hypothetical protein SAMN05421687_101130 [Salimicrobium flavidum]|uniref:Competence protein ComGG n=1 Tax=Salimicrobium flavidum TaxID=570947 RepID=A0A1N7IIN6_9BACI|nr:hypothetical protein SAMN05421687_101130 [Salimicrobium flavidum]
MIKYFSFLKNEQGIYYPFVLAFCSLFLLVSFYLIHSYHLNLDLNNSMKDSYQIQQYYQSAYNNWSPFIKASQSFPLTIERSFEDGSASVSCTRISDAATCEYNITYKELFKSYRHMYEFP